MSSIQIATDVLWAGAAYERRALAVLRSATLGGVIPSTRQPRRHRRPHGLPFASGEEWRPLRLVVDDESLSSDEIALLLAFVDTPELELIRTTAGAWPRLEPQPPKQGFVPIHRLTEDGLGGVFGVWNPAQLLLDPALQPDQHQRERDGVEPAQLSPASTFGDRPACAARVGRQLVDVADHAATDG